MASTTGGNEHEYGEPEGVSRDPLERMADALEKLAADPDVEIDAGPAFCPHCGTLNPVVTVLNTDGAGNLEDFILVAECHECNHTMYGVVESWSMFNSHVALEADIALRKGGSNE
jgi:hypothetical protein